MLTDNAFFYRLDGLQFRSVSGTGLSISLSAKAAAFAAKQVVTADVRSQVKSDLRARVAGIWPGTELSSVAVMWHRESLLPSGFQVPGEATQLGAMPAVLDAGAAGLRAVEYTDHNIDTPEQAVGLISLWTGWAEMIAALAAIQEIEIV